MEKNGTTYHDSTYPEVVDVLERVRASQQRIVVAYGDVTTGRDWGDTHDVAGRVGRSMGPVKVPLLIHNSRSFGGPAMLDHCIVQIRESRGGRVLYQHPNYHKAVK